MATAVREKTSYRTYGSAAYDPAYTRYAPGGNTAAGEAPLLRPRERVTGRARVHVRAAGYVAPTAVIGFILVGIMAILILMSYAQITAASNELVHLRQESAELADTHSKLLAEYELAYDLKTVEETVTVSGAMVQPQPGQLISLDLSEPDSARIYEPDKGSNVVLGFWNGLKETVGNVVAFFR